MKVRLKNRKFSSNAPTGYIPKDGEVWEAVNEDTGARALVMVKKDGPQDGGCRGCIGNTDRWDAVTCTDISCGKYDFTLVDLDEVLEEL